MPVSHNHADLVKSNPSTVLDRPWHFQEAEVPRFQDNQHTKVVRLSTLHIDCLNPPTGKIPGTYFCSRLSQTQDHSVARSIMSGKNKRDTIWNWIRDLPACSAEPQPNAPLGTKHMSDSYVHPSRESWSSDGSEAVAALSPLCQWHTASCSNPWMRPTTQKTQTREWEYISPPYFYSFCLFVKWYQTPYHSGNLHCDYTEHLCVSYDSQTKNHFLKQLKHYQCHNSTYQLCLWFRSTPEIPNLGYEPGHLGVSGKKLNNSRKIPLLGYLFTYLFTYFIKLNRLYTTYKKQLQFKTD